MATKLGFSIESSLASNHLTDAKYIKGGFFVVKDTATRDALVVATDTQDGTIEDGSFCFCKADRKFYQYDGREVDGVVKGWVEKDFSEGGGSGGGEQGTPRATNYVFENIDRFNDWWISEDRPKLVQGDAFYIGNVPWIDDTEKAFPDYIWDGTVLKETIMPFAKLPLPNWLGEEDGTIKKGLSLMDIGNMPTWLSELTVVFDKGGSFKDYYPFELSVDDIVAKKNYATKGEIPTTLPANDVYEWAKAATKPEYYYSEIKNTPTIPSSLPANDVYDWAKESTKPTYNYTEIASYNGVSFEQYINTLIDSALGGIIDGTVKF